MKIFSQPSFIPSDIPGLQLWLLSDSGVTLNGSTVSLWLDQSDSSNNAIQGTASNQPEFINNISLLNEHPVLRFNGSTTFLDLIKNPIINSSQYTIFILERLDIASANGYLYDFDDGLDHAVWNDGINVQDWSGNGNYYSSDTFYHIIGKTYNSLSTPNSFQWNNGNTAGPGNSYPAASNSSGKRIGGYFGGGFNFNGDIAEIIIYDTALIMFQRQQVEQYLSNKYAPPVNLGADITVNYGFCPVQLNAHKDWFTNYQWNTWSTIDSISVNSSGIFSVTVTNIFGYTSSDTIKVTYPGSLNPFPDTTICYGDTTLKWNTQLNKTDYGFLWQDSSTDSVMPVTQTGEYYVKVTDTIGAGCVRYSDTINVTVNNFSQVASLGPDTSYCAGATLGLISGASQALSYLWSTLDTTPSIIVVSSDTFYLTVQNVIGCVAKDTIIINVKGVAPTADFSATVVCLGYPTVFTDLSTVPSPDSISAWIWDFGDSVSSSLQNPSHTYTTSGTDTAFLTVVSDSLCSGTIKKSVIVNDKPNANFSVSPTCTDVIVNFTDLSSVSNDVLISWNWNFGDSATASVQNTVHTYATVGTYTVQFIVTSSSGCKDTATSLLNVLSPEACFIPPDIFSLKLWLLSDSGVTLNGSTVSLWLDQSDSSNNAIQGTTSNQPEFINNISLLNEHPVLRFNGSTTFLDLIKNPITNSSQYTIFILGRLGIASANGYLYDFDNGFDHAVWNDGINVQDWNGKGNYYSSDTLYHIIGKTYTTLSTPNSFLWNNGNTAGQGNSYPVASDSSGKRIGGYFGGGFNFNGDIAEVIIYDTAITDSQRYQVTGYLRNKYAPPVSLGADIFMTSFCPNILDANKRYLKFQWSTDTLTDTLQTLTITKSGSYAVSVTDIFGFTSSDTVNISYPGNLNPFPDTTICLNDTLTWNTGLDTIGYKFQWSTGDSTSSLIKIDTAGDYWVKVTDTSGCSFTSDTITVNIDSFSITASLGPTDTVLCSSNYLSLISGAAQASTYLWNTGATTSSILLDTVGTYTLAVTDTNGCKANDTISITIKGKAPNANLNASGTCFGDSTYFSDQSTVDAPFSIVSWQWNFGDSNTDTLNQNPTHYYSSEAQYGVVLTVKTDSGCIDTAVKNIDVNAVPDPDFSPVLGCSGESVVFVDKSNVLLPSVITGWQWEFGDGSKDSVKTPQYAYIDSGRYTVKLVTYTNNGCSDSTSKTIEIKKAAVPAFTASSVCYGEYVTFSDISVSPAQWPIDQWYWDFGDGGTDVVKNTTHLFNKAGYHKIMLTVSSVLSGCSAVVSDSVLIHPFPAAGFTGSNPCINTPFQYTDNSSVDYDTIAKWQWDFDGKDTLYDKNPVFSFNDTLPHPVKLIVTSSGGCMDSITRTIYAQPFPVADFTFSPKYGIPPGATVNLTNTSVGAKSYLWNFGDSSLTDTSKNVVHIYSDTGKYYVIMVGCDSFGCCDTNKQQIDVRPPSLDVQLFIVTAECKDEFVQNISASFINKGTREITSLDLYARMEGGTAVKEKWTGFIYPGGIDAHPFAVSLQIDPGNEVSFLCVWVDNPNGNPDEMPDDNKVCIACKNEFAITAPFPNPATGDINLWFVLASADNVDIALFDDKGSFIGSIFSGKASKGLNQVILNTQNLGKGVYAIRFIYSDDVYVKPFVKN